ncbi:MAG: DUF1553 domain-containing protein, partial [Planctomycetales bacterium]
TRFLARGRSWKGVVREIVLSRAYRQASTFDDESFRRDPDNRMLWRANKRRLDAEAIRDGMLFVSGDLDVSRPESSLIATIGERPVSLLAFSKAVPSDLDGSRRRSVYLPVVRDRLPDVLELFDFAEPSLVTGARETTNTPLQALYLMNSEFVRLRSRSLADRVCKQFRGRPERIRQAFWLCFSRPPDDQEVMFAERFLDTFPRDGENETNQEAADRKAFAAYCQSLLATVEFRAVD